MENLQQDMNAESEAAFARLQRVDWARCGKGDYSPKHEELFFAYINIARAICRHIGSKSDLYHYFSRLFNHVAERYGDLHPLPEDVAMALERLGIREYGWGGSMVTAALYGFVLWPNLSEMEKRAVCPNPIIGNPFTKLIEFFEAGGAFTQEHNMFLYVYPLRPEGMGPGVKNAFERLQQINWAGCGKGPYSPKIPELFDRYLKVARACYRPEDTGQLESLFSFIFKMYGKKDLLSADTLFWLEFRFPKQYQWPGADYVRQALYGFILWYGLSPEEREKITDDPAIANPYTPLIEFFEAGGAFSCQDGAMEYVYPLPSKNS